MTALDGDKAVTGPQQISALQEKYLCTMHNLSTEFY
ncbi:hypothetical protein Xcab_02855 [Xenorhabdus cabanillasii JM26]|nr:hypothetical protein Xcab_02855 [Xenorhabdus cabanillasii JM26]